MNPGHSLARINYLLAATLVSTLLLTPAARRAGADDEQPQRAILLADGKLQLTAPDHWKRKKPRSRIIEYEFAAPAVEGDKIEGRITVMGAGGSVDANIDRWLRQFLQPEGTSPRDPRFVKKIAVAGTEVHLVDIAGTFQDQPGGPFRRTRPILRDNYRMLGAIIVTDGLGQYFVKLYGPRKTVAANEKAFREMIQGLNVK